MAGTASLAFWGDKGPRPDSGLDMSAICLKRYRLRPAPAWPGAGTGEKDKESRGG
jgi:hypothetical protein